MKILDFLNSRSLGKSRITSLDSYYWRPNLDSVLPRLACREDDVYLSIGEGSYVPPFACKFRKDSRRDLLAVANEDGDLMLIDTYGNEGLVKSYTAHNNAIFDLCWLSDKNHLVTVSGDHRACLWDMNTCKLISSFKNHTESIKSVDVCPLDNALFATASKDGTICLWDTRDKCNECGNCRDKPSISIKSAHVRKLSNQFRSRKLPPHNSSISGVSALAFQDKINLASSGNSDGVVKIWDLRKTYISKPTYIPSPRYQMKYGENNSSRHGCTSLVFDSSYKKLYGCTTAHKIFMFDCHSYSDAAVSYEGFKCKTYFIKMSLSADDQYLLSGSSNNKAYIWKTSKPGSPILELSGHTAEVTAVAWGSDDITKLVTCGDDNKIFVWKTINDPSEERLIDIVATPSAFQTYENSSTSHQNKSYCVLNNRSSPATTSTPNNNRASLTSRHSTPTMKTPVMKSITSFFHPVVTPSPQSNSDSDSFVSPIQVLSPSKNINRNISPSKISTNSKSPKKKSLQFKENQAVSSFECSSSGQTKRKSTSNESTPKFQKTRRQNSRSVSKKPSPESAITNYFKIAPSE